MKAVLVDEMKSGGGKSPQYFPMRGEALESPSYNINLSLKQQEFAYQIKSNM